MADSATQSGGDAPANRKSGSESDAQREPGRNQSMSNSSQRDNLTELVRSGDPIALAAIASVFLSLFTYYGRSKKQQGIFVGLWAPTLLAMASYVDRRANEEQN